MPRIYWRRKGNQLFGNVNKKHTYTIDFRSYGFLNDRAYLEDAETEYTISSTSAIGVPLTESIKTLKGSAKRDLAKRMQKQANK